MPQFWPALGHIPPAQEQPALCPDVRADSRLFADACRGVADVSVYNRKEPMKKIVQEVSGEGLDRLLGERITMFCANYIYTGVLAGVNESCVLLTNAAIVYETGPFGDKAWKDAQNLPGDWYVQIAAIESFGALK
jgi:hypothetical protein